MTHQWLCVMRSNDKANLNFKHPLHDPQPHPPIFHTQKKKKERKKKSRLKYQ